MTLADYYRAMPILSIAFPGVLHRSPYFVETIPKYAWGYLEAANKLRSTDLFHDSLIFCINPWPEPEFQKMIGSKLLKLARNTYNALCAKIMRVQNELLEALRTRDITSTEEDYEVWKVFKDAVLAHESPEFSLPAYYEDIRSRYDDGRGYYDREVKQILAPLFANIYDSIQITTSMVCLKATSFAQRFVTRMSLGTQQKQPGERAHPETPTTDTQGPFAEDKLWASDNLPLPLYFIACLHFNLPDAMFN